MSNNLHWFGQRLFNVDDWTVVGSTDTRTTVSGPVHYAYVLKQVGKFDTVEEAQASLEGYFSEASKENKQ